MWRIVLRMLSTGSLAAFSAALLPPGPTGLSARHPAAVSTVSARATQAPGSGQQSVSPPVLKPGQVLPRGSLLNLSV